MRILAAAQVAPAAQTVAQVRKARKVLTVVLVAQEQMEVTAVRGMQVQTVLLLTTMIRVTTNARWTRFLETVVPDRRIVLVLLAAAQAAR